MIRKEMKKNEVQMNKRLGEGRFNDSYINIFFQLLLLKLKSCMLGEIIIQIIFCEKIKQLRYIKLYTFHKYDLYLTVGKRSMVQLRTIE